MLFRASEKKENKLAEFCREKKKQQKKTFSHLNNT